jgi:2-polyprenyl-3-methyl-5-hydroxy-6-metoxy-1,4-benzoquinol methylase
MNDVDTREYWEELYRNDPRNVYIEDSIVEEETTGLPPGTAVDLGCGTGANAIALARKGWTVTGIDWSERAIEIARKEAADLPIEFIIGDITSWDPGRRFDLVISMYSLVGGEMVEKVLRKASSLLAPGGTLLVTEWHLSMAAEWGWPDDDLYTAEQISALLTGLTIEKTDVRTVRRLGEHARACLVRARIPSSPGF